MQSPSCIIASIGKIGNLLKYINIKKETSINVLVLIYNLTKSFAPFVSQSSIIQRLNNLNFSKGLSNVALLPII